MKRLILVYNPRSSRFSDVKSEVISRVKELKGYLVGKYEITPTNMEENITNLSKILRNHDLVLSAGGDATSAIAVNAILKSNLDVNLAVLPYGNFNDLSRTLGVSRFEKIFSSNIRTKILYPLEIHVDNKLVRYATCYITIGMTAESVKIYNEPKVRKKLKTNFGRKVGSYISLAGWYFKNRHHQDFLPVFQLNGKTVPVKTSDYIAVNGRYVARVMNGGMDYLHPKTFKSNTYRLTSFWRLFRMMATSILRRFPGLETQGDVLTFTQPSNITLQAEGESIPLKNVRKIEIKKADKYLKVIVL